MRKIMMFSIIIICLLVSCRGGNTETINSNATQTIDENKNEIVFEIILEDNETATAFSKLMPISMQMTELNGNEMFYMLSNSLPINPQQVRNIQKGDVMLYGSNTIVLFYKSFSTSYSYTKIGRVSNLDDIELVIGQTSVLISFK